jgi:L-fuconolactonase
MIIDAHSHAWDRWPYQPEVPDSASHGIAEQLLWEMDRNKVDKAVLVCAQIEHNPANNDYVAASVSRYPDRLIQFADVDCVWSPTYHTPGAAARLRAAAKKYNLKGFTHYLKDDYAWLESEEGLAFFETAAECKLIASIALNPSWHPALRKLAARFPTIPFLCHHMSLAKVGDDVGLAEIVKSAEVPNIYIKLSGFHYVSRVAWDYPQLDTHPVVQALFSAFGPTRMCWGSDYPVVRFFMTYQHALEAFRTHCTFIPPLDQALILGLNLERLLAAAGS